MTISDRIAEGEPLMGSEIILDGVSSEFRKLLRAFDPNWAPGEFPKGTKGRLSGLKDKYMEVWGTLALDCEYINGDWKGIEGNAARCNEVNLFLHSYKSLENAVLELDDSCIRNMQRADELFAGSTLMMDYVYMLNVYDRHLEYADSFLSGATLPNRSCSSPYDGLADKLFPFMTGITQKQLEDFLLRDEIPLLHGFWTGSKRDATFFGNYFGKACWQMNRMWSYVTDRKGSSKLSYKHNPDKNVKTSDLIYMILKEYPGAKLREKGDE